MVVFVGVYVCIGVHKHTQVIAKHRLRTGYVHVPRYSFAADGLVLIVYGCCDRFVVSFGCRERQKEQLVRIMRLWD